jgi:phosphoribosylformylglycinamidine synthase
MPTPRVLVLRAPGTNCDRETAHAFEQAGGHVSLVHINRLLEAPRIAADFQILCIPGGFSYGDDVAAGRILANQIRHHLRDVLEECKAARKLILGICNGFQVLIKSGLLLEDDEQGTVATLAWNDSGRYEDRWVRLRVESDRCVFLRGIESLYVPVAHAEGKFVARDAPALARLEENGQLPLRYAGDRQAAQGQVAFPDNPNGSQANVAGVCDRTGRVLGLMPHPERHIDPTQHPRWTRGVRSQQGDGLAVFQNAVRHFSE